MIASVVVLGLGESKLIGFVTTESVTSGVHAAFQSNRAEQKAPHDLNNSAQTFTLRETIGSSARLADPVLSRRPESLLELPWFQSLCLPFHSDESPRAPPRWDFLFFPESFLRSIPGRSPHGQFNFFSTQFLNSKL